MGRYRPVKRLIQKRTTGEGKAEVATKKIFKNIIWQSRRGSLGYRNVAIVWMLFGSGLRVNEVAKLTVADLVHESGDIKTTFTVPSAYTKTNKPRAAYVVVKAHKDALERWIEHRRDEKVFMTTHEVYRGLNPESPMFAVTKKGRYWRTMSFKDKKYRDADGNVKTTKVCSSMQTLISEIFKNSGLPSGSSHSGRRSLATWMDEKEVELETIQKILGHETPDMTLEYIDPNLERIKAAFNKTLSGITLPDFGNQLINESDRDR